MGEVQGDRSSVQVGGPVSGFGPLEDAAGVSIEHEASVLREDTLGRLDKAIKQVEADIVQQRSDRSGSRVFSRKPKPLRKSEKALGTLLRLRKGASTLGPDATIKWAKKVAVAAERHNISLGEKPMSHTVREGINRFAEGMQRRVEAQLAAVAQMAKFSGATKRSTEGGGVI